MEILDNAHHGKNVVLARHWKGFTQATLASETGYTQEKISKLEKMDVIPDPELEAIAKAMNVDPDFIRSFKPDEHTKNYNNMVESPPTNSTTNTVSENSKEEIIQMDQGEVNQVVTNYNYPIEDIKKLYERLLKKEGEENKTLKRDNEKLRQQIEDLLHKG